MRLLALQASRYADIDVPFAIQQIDGWQRARIKLPSWPNNTSVSESNLNASLQPNPATSYTMLNCPAGSVVTVCDVQGRILSTSVVGHNMESLRIETAGFEAGLYFVTINDGAARQTLKLMVR